MEKVLKGVGRKRETREGVKNGKKRGSRLK